VRKIICIAKKIGKTYRMPAGLEDPNKKGKKKTEPKITEETEKANKKKENTDDRTFALRGAYFPEFDYIYTRIMKTRQQERRKFKEDLLAQVKIFFLFLSDNFRLLTHSMLLTRKLRRPSSNKRKMTTMMTTDQPTLALEWQPIPMTMRSMLSLSL
jgi:hypothetical protein